MDNTTNLPVTIRNDNGMEGIFVFGFDTEAGQQLYIEAITNLTGTGIIDGFFGDKFDKGATLKGNQWQICNHECGNVSADVATKWNAGKAKVVTAVNSILGVKGPWFANGNQFEDISSNFHGSWGADSLLHQGDPRDLVQWVQGDACMANHSYCYLSSTGDQHWTTDPNDPASLQSACNSNCLGRFLLAVEEGVFLGTNGWDEQYYYPLGNPLGDAVFTPATSKDDAAATLVRHFESGTYVVFTYNKNGTADGSERMDGHSVIYWEGKPPAPTPPGPPPSPPAPAPSPGPPLTCGSCGSSQLVDTTFSGDDVAPAIASSTVAQCCIACAQTPKCVQWSHHAAEGSGGKSGCHLHGKGSTSKSQSGTVSGVMDRTRMLD